MTNNINGLRNRILEQFQNIDFGRYYRHIISKSDMLVLTNLVEAFSANARFSNKRNLLTESKSYQNVLDKLSKEYLFRKKHINEAFSNPFDDDVESSNDNVYIDDYNYDSSDGSPLKKNIKIYNVGLWNNDVDDKVSYREGKMISNRRFYRGDIIERSPVELIGHADLYSKKIREFAFVVDREKDIYAIPFGHAMFYRNGKDKHLYPNADYSVNFETQWPYIEIYATKDIKKGDEVVLYADDSDFVNDVDPDEYRYQDSYETSKDFHF